MTSPPRRWFRFSLRTLLVLMTVLACALGLFVGNYRLAVHQREVLLAIKGSAAWEYEWSRRGWAEPEYVPRWLVSLLGPDFFGNVVKIYIWPNGNDADSQAPMSVAYLDSMIPLLEQLPCLEEIETAPDDVSREAYEKLCKGYPHLSRKLRIVRAPDEPGD